MRLLLADDHQLFAGLVKTVLELTAGLHVDLAIDYAQARDLAASTSYDVILLDLHMPGMGGLTGLSRMRAAHPGTPVAIISGSGSPADIRAALRLGAAGYIPKTVAPHALAGALQTIHAGRRYLPPGQDGVERTGGVGGYGQGDDLTARERDVFACLLDGRKNREIAADLGIAEFTVKTHLKNIFLKIGARNRGDAIRIGLTATEPT